MSSRVVSSLVKHVVHVNSLAVVLTNIRRNIYSMQCLLLIHDQKLDCSIIVASTLNIVLTRCI